MPKLSPSESVGFLIRDSMMLLHKVLRNHTQKHGISTAQWVLLRVLWEEEGLSQRELSDRVNTAEPTTQSALIRMEKMGILNRVDSEEDRRAKKIYLTEAGRKLEAEMIPYAMDVNTRATRGMSKSEITALKRLINQVRRNLLEDIRRPA